MTKQCKNCIHSNPLEYLCTHTNIAKNGRCLNFKDNEFQKIKENAKKTKKKLFDSGEMDTSFIL